MNLLNYDGKLFHFLNKVADCMILSVLWLVCCVPLFTVGTSTAALYYSIVKVIRDEDGTAFKTFRHGFKTNFKQGTWATLLVVVLALLITAIGSAVYAVSKTQNSLTAVYFMYLVLLGFCIAWLHYVFSYIARFEAPLGTILKNSLAICLTNLPHSISMAVLFILMVVILILTFPGSAYAGIIVPGAYALLSSYILEKIYLKYIPEEHSEEAEEEA